MIEYEEGIKHKNDVMALVPNDKRKQKRLKNIGNAKKMVCAMNNNKVMGCVYYHKRFGFKSVSWFVQKRYRKQHIGTKCLDLLKQNEKRLYAVTLTEESRIFAEKNGFKKLFSLFGRTFFVWRR